MRTTSIGRDDPVTLRPESVRVSVTLLLLGWLCRRVWRLLILILTSPAAIIAVLVLASAILVWRRHGPAPVAVALVLIVTVLTAWWLRWPAGFDRHVRCRVRGWVRGLLVYRRVWLAAMTTAGLSMHRDTTPLLPRLGKVTSTSSIDRARLRMLPGQTLDDYAAVSDRLAQTFGVQACRVRSVPDHPHQLELSLLVRDPLTATVRLFPPVDLLLPAGIPVAFAEDGTIWLLRLIGSHVLVVGATGSGKGSVLWSILAGLTPSISAGVVKVWAVDPKGGMELAPGRALFDRFCHGGLADTTAGYEAGFAELLEDAVTVMRHRQDRLRGVTRLHEASVEEPLIVLVVDELAALTAWIMDRTAKKRIETALGLLMSQGRAVGVVVVGAVQDPRKDVLPMRDLFPTRVALRLNEAEQVHLVLGPGARNRGAFCDLIPDTLPGVGYVAVDGLVEPVRVRFSYVDDEMIAELAAPLTKDRAGLQLVEGGAA